MDKITKLILKKIIFETTLLIFMIIKVICKITKMSSNTTFLIPFSDLAHLKTALGTMQLPPDIIAAIHPTVDKGRGQKRINVIT